MKFQRHLSAILALSTALTCVLCLPGVLCAAAPGPSEAGAATRTPPPPPSSAPAPTKICFAGVLGNSGAAGATLVKYPDQGRYEQARQNGLGIDSSGFLWAFSGITGIACYAPDGRQIASHALPPALHRGWKVLALVDDTLVLLGGGRLWTLPLPVPAGTLPEDIKLPAKALSLNGVGGRVAYITPEREVRLLTVNTRETVSRGFLPEGTRDVDVALLPDGTIYVGRAMRITPEGKQVEVNIPGNGSLQWANGYLYTFAWHTTIQRLDTSGAPDPGVVYGGSSGAFIGTLPKDGEMNGPSGIVHLGGDRYAATGEQGIIHILQWDASKRAFARMRRIGAIHRAAGLGIDRQGRVWWNCGYWNWTDGPAALPRNTTWTTSRVHDQWQIAFLDSGAMTGLAVLRDEPALIRNVVDFSNSYERGGDSRYDREGLKNIQGLPEHATGAAVLGKPGNEEVLVVDARGTGVRLRVDANGNARGERARITLKLKRSGTSAISSLAVHPGSGNLVATDGNAIVELRPDGDSFEEATRHTGWGQIASTQFGSRLWLDMDGDMIWASDAENNRVVLLLLRDSRLGFLAMFEGNEESGPLDQPQRISARAGRAVVLDRGNQRLIKLERSR
jgi:hypothetical protein